VRLILAVLDQSFQWQIFKIFLNKNLIIRRWRQVLADFILADHTLSIANTSVDTESPVRFIEYGMSVPSKANIGKPDNLARVRVNHQPGTEPCV